MTVKTTGKVLFVVLVAVGVFIALSTMVNQVQPEDVPAILSPIWNYVVAFFNLGQVTTILGLAVSIFGYLKNYFLENHDEVYDFNQLGKTLAVYIGIITSVLAAITPLKEFMPAPYNEYISSALAVGAAVIVVLDLVKKQIAEIGQQIRNG